MTEAVVVGGGVAGLVAARDLAKAGVHVVLVEASGALGGMVRRHTVGGIDLDMAAESFATRTEAVRTLAIELGLGNDLVTPDARGAWLMTRAGIAAPMPATGLLGIPGTPMAADVIRVVGQRAALRAQMDSLLPSPVGAKASSLGALVRARMGDGVLDDLVVPVVTGVHSTHPDDLDPDRVAPGLRAALAREGSLGRAVLALRERQTAGSAVAGIRGGIVRLVDELVRDMETYGVDVRLHTRAVRIERAAVDVVPATDAVPAVGHVETERLVADHVFAAVPDPARADAAAPDAAPAAVRGSDRSGIELVTLVVRQPALDDGPRGTGMLVHPDAPVGAKAITHATVKWPWLAERTDGAHVLRLSYAGTADAGSALAGSSDAGSAHASIADGGGSAGVDEHVGTSIAVDPDSALAARATSDAATLLGAPLDPGHLVGAARVRWHGPDTRDAGLAEGVVGIGEASTSRGLAGIVGSTRDRVREVLSGESTHP